MSNGYREWVLVQIYRGVPSWMQNGKQPRARGSQSMFLGHVRRINVVRYEQGKVMS